MRDLKNFKVSMFTGQCSWKDTLEELYSPFLTHVNWSVCQQSLRDNCKNKMFSLSSHGKILGGLDRKGSVDLLVCGYDGLIADRSNGQSLC